MRNDRKNHMPLATDRRRLLQMMGLSSGSLFLPSLLGDKAARAAENGKKLLLFYTRMGLYNNVGKCVKTAWPTGAAQKSGTAPLHRHSP